MSSKTEKTGLGSSPQDIDSLIIEVRRQKVILDGGLARVYGVPTKALNQAVKRNRQRFPADFLFELTADEVEELSRPQFATGLLRSQFVTSKVGRGGRRYLPYAFTEHGAIMAATILNSARAVEMSVFVVRAFVKMRAVLTDTRELAGKLAALEQELKGRLDVHEAAIVDVLQRIMRILDPPPARPEPPRPQIGFKEDGVPYRLATKPAQV